MKFSPRSTKFSQISFIFILALLASACGQSKVEYKKGDSAENSNGASAPAATDPANTTAANDTDNATDADPKVGSTEPITDEILTENQTPETFDEEALEADGISVVRAKPLREYTIGKERFKWQTWKVPSNTRPALDNEEKLGLGDSVIDEDFASGSAVRKAWERGTTLFNLADHSKARCVFRNRLIESVPLATKNSEVLPPPFGNHRLYCIDFRGAAHSFIQLERTPTSEGDSYWVRWMGSTGKKKVPAKGAVDVEFKLTSRIFSPQGFPKAAYLALSDRMDQLLATTANTATGQDCTLERVFFLRVRFNNGSPAYGKLYSRTRHFAADDYFNWLDKEQKTLPVGYGSTRLEIPRIHTEAQSACRFQHAAWVACLKSNGNPDKGAACERKVMNLLSLNFADLLNERVKGFASDRIFTLTRNDANGLGKKSALTLWYDLETPVSNPQGYNPLSLEDFQEVTDIVDLKLQ